jgi:hypothetical protein
VQKGLEGVAEAAEHLLCKWKTLSLNSGTAEKKNTLKNDINVNVIS